MNAHRLMRGVALLVLLVTAWGHVSPREATAFELDGAVWRVMPVTYCVNPAGPPLWPDGTPMLTAEGFVEMVRAQFQKWEDAEGSRLRFIYGGTCTNRPGRADDVNVVGWGNLGNVRAIGRAFADESKGKYLRGGASYEILESDIQLNSRVDFYKDLDYYLSTILPHTILHEIGHFIGVGHSETKPCTVMTSLNTYPTELCQDDIDGAALLYPG